MQQCEALNKTTTATYLPTANNNKPHFTQLKSCTVADKKEDTLPMCACSCNHGHTWVLVKNSASMETPL